MESITKQEITRMAEELSEEIKEVRHVVMTRNTYDRYYEKSL